MNNNNLIKDLKRTQEDIFSLKGLTELLNSKKQIRIKYGVDVTAPYLHIGHAVNLWMMRKFQDYGHKVIFLIGDFTTKIGDPTGKSKTRPIIPQKEIEINMEKFINQAKMVLRFDDTNLIEIRKNSEWYNGMKLSDFIPLLSMVSHAKLISRDMFQKRIQEDNDIFMHELVYPVLQGYDSVMLNSDLTIIGSDQLFNEMLGRFYQEKFNQKPQVIITTKITPGINGGEKQSKSLGNYIGLDHSPRDKFGKTMRVLDELILCYFEIYTEVSTEKLEEIKNMVKCNPMEAKKQLATEIVSRYHGNEIADKEREWFENVFSMKKTPENLSTLKPYQYNLISVLFESKLSLSKSEARRVIEQGGVKINGNVIKDINYIILPGSVLQKGKISFIRIL
ncbi:MAG: tyrosine--tRNA ligase [archaeon]|nr:tyrosine--tRNA ligase [archaeon]